jgi:hypothetical protein
MGIRKIAAGIRIAITVSPATVLAVSLIAVFWI